MPAAPLLRKLPVILMFCCLYNGDTMGCPFSPSSSVSYQSYILLMSAHRSVSVLGLLGVLSSTAALNLVPRQETDQPAPVFDWAAVSMIPALQRRATADECL